MTDPTPDPRDATIAALRAEARSLRDLLAKCGDDRQRYFTENARLRSAMAELIVAAARLSVAAQTTGGTAGRDEGLCEAIDLLAPHIEAARAFRCRVVPVEVGE